MKALQSLIPNSNKVIRRKKATFNFNVHELGFCWVCAGNLSVFVCWFCGLQTDKASMLDEAIEYLKQLQLQVQVSR
jgi:hypothetical protein